MMNDQTDRTDLTDVVPHIKFRFHVENPTLEECYAYGYECALADVQESESPYESGSHEHEQWVEGWWTGFYKEQPLFSFDAEHPEDNVTTVPAVNDGSFHDVCENYLLRALEIASVIAVSAILGYQVIDLVA